STTYYYGAVNYSGIYNLDAGSINAYGNDVILTSTDNINWNTASAEMDIITGTWTSFPVLHNFTYPGLNLGKTYAGYTNNFAWKTLSIQDNNYLVNSSGA